MNQTRSSSIEYITCAAIHINDKKKHKHQPKNRKLGFVLAGHRHGCIAGSYAAICENLKISQGRAIASFVTWYHTTEGFLTSKGRFVDRKEGLKIAYKAKQIPKPTKGKTILFSEDLY